MNQNNPLFQCDLEDYIEDRFKSPSNVDDARKKKKKKKKKSRPKRKRSKSYS